MQHIKNVKLTEKKMPKNDINTQDKEISQDDINRAMKIEQEIIKILADNKCTVNESYVILATMLEAIYAHSILKELGYED